MVAALPLILAGTSAINAGISIADLLTRDSQFKDVGATGAQKQALGMQSQIAGRLMSQQGMSAADVQKVQQVQQGSQQQSMQAISALQQSNLSGFDRQRIAEALTQEVQKQQKRSQDVLSLLDVGAEAQKLAQASQATAAMAAQAEQVRAAEQQKAMMQAQERQQRAQALQNIFGSLGKTAALGFMGFNDAGAAATATSPVPANMSPESLTTEGMALGDKGFTQYDAVNTGNYLTQSPMSIDTTTPLSGKLVGSSGEFNMPMNMGLGLTQGTLQHSNAYFSNKILLDEFKKAYYGYDSSTTIGL